MSESELKILISKRAYVRGQVTKIYGHVTQKLNEIDRKEKLSLMSKLKLHEKSLEDFDNKIDALKISLEVAASEIQTDYETSVTYSENLVESVMLIEQSMTSENQSNLRHAEPVQSQLKRPAIPLPTFSSEENESLEKFLYNFEATVSKYSYSSYDKLLLLKGQVTGKASVLLNSLELSEQTYESARALLVQALASPLTQKYNVLRQLANLQLNYDTEPFEYIAKMRNITESFKSLNIDLDTILQYFFWSGMNDTFKSQLTQITNQSKPSLKEMMDNFFEACERYSNCTKKFKDRKFKSDGKVDSWRSDSMNNKRVPISTPTKIFPKAVSTSFAADVAFDLPQDISIFKKCPLCEEEDFEHSINKCNKFLTPKEKLNKLIDLKRCLKCASSNHDTNKCKYRFKRLCSKCSTWHFSFLCDKETDTNVVSKTVIPASASRKFKSNNKKVRSDRVIDAENLTAVSNNVISMEMFISEGSILPTITCYIQNGDVIRCLSDSGAQANFITEAKAKANNLKIIKNDISVVINGFNGSKTYNANVVEVPLDFDGQKLIIEAICIPEININLNLPGLSQLCTKLKNAGFRLADQLLPGQSDEIKNLDMVLGADSVHILNSRTVAFGTDTPSAYFETPFGIMLTGRVDRLLTNLHCICSLPEADIIDLSDICSENNVFDSNFDMMDCNLSANFSIFNESGALIESEIKKAAEEMLERQCNYFLNYDDTDSEEMTSEINKKLINHVFKNIDRSDNGRLIAPLLWDDRVAHHLGTNFNLSKQILMSNFKKLSKNKEHLLMYDKVFKDQEKLNIIERIEDVSQFIAETPRHSFLPHMGVFRPGRETTKLRVVFLSNLCERDPNKNLTVSHNQAILPGPCLNAKIATALIFLRFDAKLFCFDLKSAFLQILLPELDQDKLLFLWYRNVEKENFELVAYRNYRVSVSAAVLRY